jgi:tetratricopeptide (TPR) repeat protein
MRWLMSMIESVGHRVRARQLLVAALLASTSVHGLDLAAANQHLEAGRFDRLEALVADEAEDDADAAYFLGRVRYQQREWDDAADLFEEAVEMGRDDVETNLWLAEAKSAYAQNANMFSAMGAARAAKRAYQRAVEIGPEDARARLSLIGFLAGAPAIAGGDLDLAREHAEVLRGLDPWMAVRADADILRAEDEDADLVPLYAGAASSMPDAAEPQFILGLMYMQAERYDDAERQFLRTAELEPDHDGVRYQFGKFAAVTGTELERGIEQLTIYLAQPIDPGDPGPEWVNYRMGMIYEHLGDTAAAMMSYRAALEIDDDHELADEALRRLERDR